MPEKASNPSPEDKAVDLEDSVKSLVCDFDAASTDTVKTYLGESPDSLKRVNVSTIAGYAPAPFYRGHTYYWRVDVSNQNGTVQGDLWSFTMKSSLTGDADYLQDSDNDGLVVIEAEDFTQNTIIGDNQWTFITEPAGYSGRGVMQVLPDIGKFYSSNYSQRASRLDYSVNFIKAGTHYIWIRGYSQKASDRGIHIGINEKEDQSSSLIGNFQKMNEWEWLNGSISSTLGVRIIEVQVLGVQNLNLWFARDGAIVDKIILTSNPNYVPSGLGPASSYTAVESPAEQQIPIQYTLFQNYPNPFNPSTTIGYSLVNSGHVWLRIYDITGWEFATLIDEHQSAGFHSIRWDIPGTGDSNLSSGIYLAQLVIGDFTQSMKLIVLK